MAIYSFFLHVIIVFVGTCDLLVRIEVKWENS